MKATFKKLISLMLAAALLACCFAALAAAKVTTLDATKQKLPASFIAAAKAAKADYDAGKFIAAPFIKASDITKEALSTLVPDELNALEECFFPKQKTWYDKKGKDLHGKLSTAKLSKDDKAAVELIRSEAAACTASMGTPIKSGDSFDLNGDGKKEKITYVTSTNDFGLAVKVGSAKAELAGYYTTGVWALDVAGKTYLLCSYVTDDDYGLTEIYSYDGKKLTMVSDRMGGSSNLRYVGDGKFIERDLLVPVAQIKLHDISTGKLTTKTGRAQPPIQVVTFNAASEYGGAYQLKCKSIDGKSVTFKAGQKLAVIASTPCVFGNDPDEFEVKSEACVALMDEKGNVGVITTENAGYCLAGVYDTQYPDTAIWFVQCAQGFVFMP